MVGMFELLQSLIATLVFIALSYYSTSWVRDRKDSEINKQAKAKKVKKKGKKLKKGKGKDNIEIEPDVLCPTEEDTKPETLKPKALTDAHIETMPTRIEAPAQKGNISTAKTITSSPQKPKHNTDSHVKGEKAKVVDPVDKTICTKGDDVKAETISTETEGITETEPRVNVVAIPNKAGRDNDKKSKKKSAASTAVEAPSVHQASTDGKGPQVLVNQIPEVIRPPRNNPIVESDGDSTDSDLTAEEVLAKRGFQVTMLGGKHRTRAPVAPLKLAEGQTVLARFKDGEEWFRGKISKVGRDKSYTITYDDGAVETKVPESRVRSTNSDYTDAPATVESDSDEKMQMQNSRDEWDFDSTMVAEEDGWEMVTAKMKQRARTGPRYNADTGEEILTKKQRESRRKKEKMKERKELMRAEAQESGLHARWGGNLRKWTSSSTQK